MRKIVFLLALLLCSTAWGQKRVLFVGNSYTAVNNLPLMLQRVAASAGQLVEVESNAPGGCTFSTHCTNQSMTLIQQGNWDFVVLQEQSQYPSFPDSQVQDEVYPYAQRLVDSVYANNPCAEPMFYMTWGRENGDSYNAQFFPILGTYEGMDSMIYVRYMYMASQNDASVCPVGRVWRYLRTNYPSIQLYQSDGSHPTNAGTYAAACAFYVMMFHDSPLHITYKPDLNANDADIIRHAVNSVVYEQLSSWQRVPPQADFSAQVADNVVHFTSQATDAEDYFWDFGDGTTSTELNPTHTYSTEGVYDVSFVASRHCMGDTAQHSVTVEMPAVGIADAASDKAPSLYPNPATDKVYIVVKESATAILYDRTGRQLLCENLQQGENSLSLEKLPYGCYLLRVMGGNDYSTVLIKK